MSARDEVLRRVRLALRDRPARPPIPRGYRRAGSQPASLDLFARRVLDYTATVHRADEIDLPLLLARLLPGPVVIPAGLDAAWVSRLAETVTDEPPLDIDALDGLPSVLTACALAIAETGTIVLDASAGQGRRVQTLVPDHHAVVVEAAQVVANVPDAREVLDPTRPQTWISGPSATSDIELRRVEGVHCPRRLDVVLLHPRSLRAG